MPATMEDLGLDKWIAQDRRRLAETIFETLPEAEEPGLEFDEWEKKMIDERLAIADANPEASRPMEEVISRLLAK